MPIYEFECPKGHRFEKLVPMGTQTAMCETCGENDTKHEEAVKVISKPSPAHFSGHGWTPPKLERK